jgi:hypothetical protein
MTNVVVTTKKPVRVTVPSEGSVLAPSSVTVRNDTRFVAGGATRLDQMADVIEQTPVDGAVLVYDSATDKYVLRPIETLNLDGGTF